MRKGYPSERLAKRELINEFGEQNVIKVAIGGAQDFIVVKGGRLIKVVEVKECHQDKFYMTGLSKDQFERMKGFCKEHGCIAELWVHYPHKKQWSKVVLTLESKIESNN